MQGSVSEFLKPRVVKVQPVAPRQARVVIEPFERGFGHTLGNALRRVLLSSMPGQRHHRGRRSTACCTSTPAIEGVQEDVVDILLNLKSVALRMHTRDTAELRLHKKGPGPVTAGDIQTDHDIEVVNPELVIANLTKAGELTMTLRVERGRGYRPAATRVAFEEQTPPDRPPAARCLVLAGAPRHLHRSTRRASSSAPTSTSWSSTSRPTARSTRKRPSAAPAASSRISCRCSSTCRARKRPPPRSPRCSSTRSCCGRSTSSSSPCAAPTASRPRTSTTSATSCSARKSSCCARRTSARSRSPRSRKCCRATA